MNVSVELAVPADPDDPYLANWVNGGGGAAGHVTFEGIECQFPGRVWKSEAGPYWNMPGSLGAKGTGHWNSTTMGKTSKGINPIGANDTVLPPQK